MLTHKNVSTTQIYARILDDKKREMVNEITNIGQMLKADYDIALKLKVDYNNGNRLSMEQALSKLRESDLIEQLTSNLQEKPLFYIWRIIALSEIPYTIHLSYTQNLIDRIYDKLSTPFGFSLGGDEKSFLPCYNAMLVSALSRLSRTNDNEVRQAVE